LAQAKNSVPAHAVQIDRTGLLILIRQTFAALDFSNKSDNSTLIRPLLLSRSDEARGVLQRKTPAISRRGFSFTDRRLFTPQP
jgi:hypothetical protein